MLFLWFGIVLFCLRIFGVFVCSDFGMESYFVGGQHLVFTLLDSFYSSFEIRLGSERHLEVPYGEARTNGLPLVFNCGPRVCLGLFVMVHGSACVADHLPQTHYVSTVATSYASLPSRQ